ncbi:P-loop containing nucleoside triphosphate hydrolase protein [Amniculicola lignicola CBS 123094]|uniref:P-loop containing nucleoside triphosphate hydrolase protein n=1 Tax=Amniculicola lignicola CBS 123094 TaxID=1392246 RepID=A0A6A5VW01_9PLEO|nr:P-loop containing nucleoside triphosphate hydrolase protein [Amniculicola lignicola CBS 123094]
MATPKVIAVMGVTGVGKSSFIKLVTGDDNIQVGDSLESETAEVNTYKFRHKDRTIILVDTPGFDDTHRKDADVLKQLAAWFDDTYKSGTKLSGIIYLHRITDDRMRGSSLRSMRMFRQLCGESFYKNLLLGTTCWSLIPEDVGAGREKELMTDENFWKGLIGKGAQFVRMPDDGWEAKELVYDLARLEPVSLQIQKEMADSNLKFGALSATQTLQEDMTNLQTEHDEQKRQLDVEHQRQLEEQNQREQRLQMEMEREKQKALLAARLNAEHEAMTESTAKFTEGVREGKFFAKLFPLAIAFSSTCDGCCKWVGNDQYYGSYSDLKTVQKLTLRVVCTKCNDGKFVLCGKCYNGALTCFDESHHNSMQMMVANDGPPQCRHITYPPSPESMLACYRCASQLAGIFVHKL